MFLKSDTHFPPFHFVHTHYYSWHRCRVNLPDSRPVNDQVFVICRPGVLVWHRHRSVYYCPTGRAAWRVQQVKWISEYRSMNDKEDSSPPPRKTTPTHVSLPHHAWSFSPFLPFVLKSLIQSFRRILSQRQTGFILSSSHFPLFFFPRRSF